MIFEKHGLSARILDSDDNEIVEYQVEETEDNVIQCWIPSTEGHKFEIEWEVMKNRHKGYDLRTVPFLDGIKMGGFVVPKKELKRGYTTQHYQKITGRSTAQLYEFGRRILTDQGDCTKPENLSSNLNTIKLRFSWGRGGVSKPQEDFYVPPELGPIHEKAAKKGHSGAAKLGKEVSISGTPYSVSFKARKEIDPVTFVFCYAPEAWLRARDIIPRSPEPELEDNKGTLKRERTITPEIVDIDELETDDDEIQIIKHMIPAPVASNKRQRTLGQTSVNSAKKEED